MNQDRINILDTLLNTYKDRDDVLHYKTFEKVVNKIKPSVYNLSDDEFDLLITKLHPRFRKVEPVRCYECGSVISDKNTTHQNSRFHKDAIYAKFGIEL